MIVTVDGGRVHLDLAPEYEGPRERPAEGSTAYLGKFGVITEWDGRGTLLGLSVPVAEGEPVLVDGGHLLTDLAASAAHPYRP